MAQWLIFYRVSFHHTHRLREDQEYSTQSGWGGTSSLPGQHCSLLYAEDDAGRVCLNMHLIYIHFFSPSTFFLFHAVISQRWRSDTFDNSGPCGVNTGVIACRSVSLFAPISQHIGACFSLSFHRRAERNTEEGEIDTKRDEPVSPGNARHVSLFCFVRFQILKSLVEGANCHFHRNDKKISIGHKGVIMTSVKNNTEDINQCPSLTSKARGKAHLSGSPMFHSGVSSDEVCGGLIDSDLALKCHSRSGSLVRMVPMMDRLALLF